MGREKGSREDVDEDTDEEKLLYRIVLDVRSRYDIKTDRKPRWCGLWHGPLSCLTAGGDSALYRRCGIE